MVRMVSGSVMSAMTRSVPPQWGHTVTSISNTRLSRCAQVSGAVGCIGSTAESAGVDAAGFFRFLCAGFAGGLAGRPAM